VVDKVSHHDQSVRVLDTPPMLMSTKTRWKDWRKLVSEKFDTTATPQILKAHDSGYARPRSTRSMPDYKQAMSSSQSPIRQWFVNAFVQGMGTTRSNLIRDKTLVLFFLPPIAIARGDSRVYDWMPLFLDCQRVRTPLGVSRPL